MTAGAPVAATLVAVQSAPARSDVGTTVVGAVGAALLLVLGLRLAYLAARTRTSVTPAQAALWEYYGYAGVLAVLYGGLVLAERRLGHDYVFLDGLLLAFALCFALALREAYYNATLSNAEVDRFGQYRLRRSLEFGFVALVVVGAVGPLVRPTAPFDAVLAVAGAAVVCYGAYFQARRTLATPTRGTLVDALTRQSLPVLGFGGAAVATPALAVVGRASPAVVDALAASLVLAAAASMLAVTLKLDQHSSTHR